MFGKDENVRNYCVYFTRGTTESNKSTLRGFFSLNVSAKTPEEAAVKGEIEANKGFEKGAHVIKVVEIEPISIFQWNKIGESEPAKGEDVLLYYSDGIINRATYIGNGKFVDYLDGYELGTVYPDTDYPVLYWALTPKIPKGE